MANCNEDGCSVLTTGICVNGLALDVCPHYSLEGSSEIMEVGESATIEENDSVIEDLNTVKILDTHSGKSLTLTEANKIARSSLTRLIILAGMPDAGKTTLILSLMYLFDNNPSYVNYIFAGSETLLDFEEKSHPSKIDSQKKEEITVRTPFGPPSFLHLKVIDSKKERKAVDLLFTDISGEAFKSLRDNTQECKNFSLGRRADHFTLFFDTQKLTSVRDRALSKSSGLGILRGLIEADTLLPDTNIQIVFSRYDLFGDNEKKNNEQYISTIKEEISKKYGELYKIEFIEIACRPKTGKFNFGHGLEKLFPIWVERSSLDSARANSQELVHQNTNRQFMKYKYKK